MIEHSCNFNKKQYTAKRINNFYFQLTSSSLPSSFFIVSDGDYFFIKKKLKKPLCSFCFNGRYFCFLNGIILGTPLTIKTLTEKKWEQLLNEQFFSSLEHVVEKISKTEWSIFEISTQKKLLDCDIISYDHCKNCFPLSIESWNEQTQKNLEAQGNALFHEFMQRSTQVSSEKDQKQLFSFLHNSFGFIAYEHTFRGSDIEPDPLKGNYLTTIFTSQPTQDEEIPPSLSLCGAQAQTKKLSRLKAYMEFCERAAYTGFRTSSPLMTNINEPSFTKQCTTLKDTIFARDYPYRFDDYALWGVDLIHNTKRLIPLSYIYDETIYYKGQAPTAGRYIASTSGFAAHTSQTKAVENSLLELIERDAFLRWWKQPETGHLFSPSFAKKNIQYLLECVRTHLNNPTLVLNVMALPSPLKVPVVMAHLTTQDETKTPALVIGTAAAFSIKDATRRALYELSVGILNLIARVQHGSALFDTPPTTDFKNIKSAQDHFYFYHHPALIKQLPFHSLLLSDEQKPSTFIETLYTTHNLEELKKEIRTQNMNAFTIDATPNWLKKYNVHVIRSAIFELLPLHFGHPLLLSMEDASFYSVKNSLPHCFP